MFISLKSLFEFIESEIIFFNFFIAHILFVFLFIAFTTIPYEPSPIKF